MAMNNINFSSIEQIHAQYLNPKVKKPINGGTNIDSSFKDILSKQLDGYNEVKFSKHANERLESRNIQLSVEQITRLEDGIMKANKKGVRDSLMLLDNVALVVNIPNKTVITAVGNEDAIDNVFTNIDGAVIV